LSADRDGLVWLEPTTLPDGYLCNAEFTRLFQIHDYFSRSGMLILIAFTILFGYQIALRIVNKVYTLFFGHRAFMANG
jgi:hypothetical protein